MGSEKLATRRAIRLRAKRMFSGQNKQHLALDTSAIDTNT